MKILITGSAGFIGYHLTKRIAELNHDIVCIDSINDYYDLELKYARLIMLGITKESVLNNKLLKSTIYSNVCFAKIDITDEECLNKLFANEHFDIVIHLAAQAGVRYSFINPSAYIKNNIQGFINILEAGKRNQVRRIVYASSSSVYGMNKKQPFAENDDVSQPVSLYAVSKRTNELSAYTYSQLFNIETTGLRFFTVYGPFGRPDMAPFIFTKAIMDGRPIDVFNNGNMDRDFTYIDDIIEGIVRVMVQETDGEIKSRNHLIYNIGRGKPVKLMDFIFTLEEVTGLKAKINFKPMQVGDVYSTWADCSSLMHDTGYKPSISLEEGIKNFIAWYRSFYGV
jgi:UDP-glucuronate 4-epimerase